MAKGERFKDDPKILKTKAIVMKINVVIILVFIVAISVLMLVLERPTHSDIEKRELAKFPELSLENYLSGQFFRDISTYFSDTVPFREDLVSLGAEIDRLMGIPSPTFYGPIKVVETEETTESTTEISTSPPETEATTETKEGAETTETEATTEETTATTEEEEPIGNLGDFNNNGIIVDGVKMYGETAGVMLFGGSQAASNRYATILNKYKETLGSEVNVYNMVVPTSAEFYLPSKYNAYSSDQKAAIDYIYSQLSEDIIPIDAYSELAAHVEEEIYFRTDHHWTQLGAYYAYVALCKEIGFDYPAIEDFEMKTKENYVGSLYTYTNDSRLLQSPETFTYYLPTVPYTTSLYDFNTLEYISAAMLFHEYASGTNTYSMFLGGDNLHLKVTTELDNDRSIIVFKESYGNAFIPYLVNSFENIYVVDIRYFGANAINYIKEQGITDVLFINNVFAANTDMLIAEIEGLYY